MTLINEDRLDPELVKHCVNISTVMDACKSGIPELEKKTQLLKELYSKKEACDQIYKDAFEFKKALLYAEAELGEVCHKLTELGYNFKKQCFQKPKDTPAPDQGLDLPLADIVPAVQ